MRRTLAVLMLAFAVAACAQAEAGTRRSKRSTTTTAAMRTTTTRANTTTTAAKKPGATTTTKKPGTTTTTKPGSSTTSTTASTSTTSTTSTSTSTSTTSTTSTSTTTTTAPASCSIFPANNPWNTDVSSAPVHANSDNFVANILANGGDFLHADFGGGGAYGIPYITVNNTTPRLPIVFTAYGDESDPGPYPIPLDAPVEGGAASDGDRHVIALDTAGCKLYELYRAFPRGDRWEADSGAVFDLRSNALRPDSWTSADAAGLPILPGLARYDEVASGAIRHALRFTVNATQRGFVHPATHFASSSTDPNRPPMGLRLRLKAGFDLSGFGGQSRVVLEALKRYGMIVADNGSNWFITGAADSRWNDDDLNQLKRVPGSAFEVVDTGPIIR